MTRLFIDASVVEKIGNCGERARKDFGSGDAMFRVIDCSRNEFLSGVIS